MQRKEGASAMGMLEFLLQDGAAQTSKGPQRPELPWAARSHWYLLLTQMEVHSRDRGVKAEWGM
jgi:hypothetical protein